MTTLKKKQTPRPSARSAGEPAPRPLGRRERNKQEKLSRIVAAAKYLFDKKGFAQTTTQEIADRADIGTGTLFLYAQSKEDLLIMVFKDEMIETSKAAFEKVPANASLLEQLLPIFGAMIDYHDKDVELAKALIKEISILASAERRDDLQALMQVIYDGIGEILATGQKVGTVSADAVPDVAAQALFGIYYLGLIGWLGGQTTKKQFLQRLPAMLSVAIDGLAPKAKAAAKRTGRTTRR